MIQLVDLGKVPAVRFRLRRAVIQKVRRKLPLVKNGRRASRSVVVGAGITGLARKREIAEHTPDLPNEPRLVTR